VVLPRLISTALHSRQQSLPVAHVAVGYWRESRQTQAQVVASIDASLAGGKCSDDRSDGGCNSESNGKTLPQSISIHITLDLNVKCA
ncbi:unnamed protein product, partial [Ceratitis capitata]